MPAWVWLFLAIIIYYCALVLSRAWNNKYVRFGPICYTANEDRAYFWFLVIVFAISEIFALSLFFVALVSVIWGPVF